MPAKYPAALLTLADVGGPVVNLGELTLSGTITSTATTIAVRTAVPSYWPTSGFFVIDSEIIAYGAIAADRLSFTSCTRAQESSNGGGAAASHTDGSTIGMYQTALQYNQVVDEVRAMQADMGVIADGTASAPGARFRNDTDTGLYRSAANTLDVSAGGTRTATFDASGLTLQSKALLQAKGADVASAAALAIGTDGNYFAVTGTTTITSIATRQAGTVITLRFDGALTLTHNATSLILQGATNLTTAAGDVLTFVSEGAGNWREKSRRLAAAAAATTAHTFVRKTATESVTSSTVLQDDDALLFAVAANEVWIFEMFLVVFGDTTGDIKFAITVPAGATLLWGQFALDTGANNRLGNLNAQAVGVSGTANLPLEAGNVISAVLLKGTVVNGATAGNVVLQWAQAVSNAVATEVRANSYLIAHKIS